MRTTSNQVTRPQASAEDHLTFLVGEPGHQSSFYTHSLVHTLALKSSSTKKRNGDDDDSSNDNDNDKNNKDDDDENYDDDDFKYIFQTCDAGTNSFAKGFSREVRLSLVVSRGLLKKQKENPSFNNYR